MYIYLGRLLLYPMILAFTSLRFLFEIQMYVLFCILGKTAQSTSQWCGEQVSWEREYWRKWYSLHWFPDLWDKDSNAKVLNLEKSGRNMLCGSSFEGKEDYRLFPSLVLQGLYVAIRMCPFSVTFYCVLTLPSTKMCFPMSTFQSKNTATNMSANCSQETTTLTDQWHIHVWKQNLTLVCVPCEGFIHSRYSLLNHFFTVPSHLLLHRAIDWSSVHTYPVMRQWVSKPTV